MQIVGTHLKCDKHVTNDNTKHVKYITHMNKCGKHVNIFTHAHLLLHLNSGCFQFFGNINYLASTLVCVL
jgi:hypothetical protein